MRKILAILVCKLIRKIGSYIGKGSSLPGKFALKICPDVLARIKLPEITIAVSGSNGKTSTVEMIYQMLEKSGLSVAYNYEGSNQIEGITTLALCNCDNLGRFQKDVLLMEVDERYAQYVFKYLTPKYFVINNLFRDQLTRNGSSEYVLTQMEKAIVDGTTLVLNCDDPLVSSLAYKFKNDVVYFGIDDNQYVSEENDGVYDDGYYCPICKHKMIYDYRQFGDIGDYHCSSCSFKRATPNFYISDISLDKTQIVINDDVHINLAFNTLFNAYNVLASFTIGRLLNINDNVIVKSLNDYLIQNGRIKTLNINNKDMTLLISKHENSTSYNQNIEYLVNYVDDVSLLLIIEDISRKYFTSDTSWLWDINFEKLENENIKKIVVAGKYFNDVAVRFEYAHVDLDKAAFIENVDEAINYFTDNSKGDLFVMTCFSDEGKLIKHVKEQS